MRALFLAFTAIAAALLCRTVNAAPSGQQEEVRYSTLLDDIKGGRVDSVVLQGDMIYGVRKDKTQFRAYNPETDHTALISTLVKAGVAIEVKRPMQPVSGTERVCQPQNGEGNYVSRIRNNCRVGDIIVVENVWDAANLCNLQPPGLSGNFGSSGQICYLAPPRETVPDSSGATPSAVDGAAQSAMDQEAVRFAASDVFRDRIKACGTRSFAYTIVFDVGVPGVPTVVLTELAKPILHALGGVPDTKADALNGLDYQGFIALRADASRRWVKGSGWTDWVNGPGGAFPGFSVRHRNGKWDGTLGNNLGMSEWKETKLDCAAIHQLEETERK